MQTNMLESAQKQAFSARFESRPVDFDALLVVYEVGDGEWRGFAHPYGETADGSSKKEVTEKLRELTTAYYNSIKRYNFPAHLVNGRLTNAMDKTVFGWLMRNKGVMSKVHSKVGKIDNPYYYVEAFRHKA